MFVMATYLSRNCSDCQIDVGWGVSVSDVASAGGAGVSVDGTGVSTCGAGVSVGGAGASVGGMGVSVGNTGASVAGTGVSVGGTGVSVGGTGVSVGGGTGVSVGGGTGVSVGGTGLSISPVEYTLSSNLPTVARITSCGSLARFSAQSVSMMPRLGWSIVSRKPLSCQNSRTGFHYCAAGRYTTSHR